MPTGSWEEAVPEPKQKLLSHTASAAILLGSKDCSLYSPLPQYKLVTPAGISRVSLDTPYPSELQYRWSIQAILRRSDEGKSVVSKQEYEAYLENPYPTNQPMIDVVFWLPYPFYRQDTAPDSGIPVPKPKIIYKNKCGGVKQRVNAQPILPPKFNTLTKGLSLSFNSLPPDAPPHLRVLASKMFNASVASSTASTYKTAAKHIATLEKSLGRAFSWPLSEQDSNLVLAHLMSKGIKPNTVKQYLAGTRRLSLSKGVSSPSPQSDLARTILKGYENVSRDPIKAVVTATHRPVSVPFLRLVGHAAMAHYVGKRPPTTKI